MEHITRYIQSLIIILLLYTAAAPWNHIEQIINSLPLTQPQIQVHKCEIVFVNVDLALQDYCHVVDNDDGKSPLFLQNLMMQCNNKSPLLLQEYSNAGQDMERFRATLRAMVYPYSSYGPLLWKISHMPVCFCETTVSFVQISQMLCIVNCSFLWNSYTQFLLHICICFQMYLSVPLQWNGMGYIQRLEHLHIYYQLNRFLNTVIVFSFRCSLHYSSPPFLLSTCFYETWTSHIALHCKWFYTLFYVKKKFTF